jgi:hypothetical protein
VLRIFQILYPLRLEFLYVVCDIQKILISHASLSLCHGIHVNCGHINYFGITVLIIQYCINNSIAYKYVGLYLLKIVLEVGASPAVFSLSIAH